MTKHKTQDHRRSQISILKAILQNNDSGLTFLKLFVSSMSFEKQYQ